MFHHEVEQFRGQALFPQALTETHPAGLVDDLVGQADAHKPAEADAPPEARNMPPGATAASLRLNHFCNIITLSIMTTLGGGTLGRPPAALVLR